ncbi:PH domain-containing protein [Paenibacillus puldeungensis]|uniref:PH domain-containing protein n=1 Tax=Paenibacillus puldeungensis TaxID=696536 RepID=A0ABW3RR14_9BACL
MTTAKRYHPLVMLLGVWKLGKSSIYFFILLFVLKMGSHSKTVTYGRLALLLIVGIGLIAIVWRWLNRRYQVDGASFHLYQGFFIKSKRVIPFAKVQNVNRHISLFHQVFKMTSIRFETGMEGDESAVEFSVISRAEADRLEGLVSGQMNGDLEAAEEGEVASELPLQAQIQGSNRTLHFSPTRRDLIKASFTSLSFLVLIPVLYSLYEKVNDFVHVDVEKEAKGLLTVILGSWWIGLVVISVLIIVSIGLGIAKTMYKYGKYEISSDSDRIYISKGLLEKTAFSISKDKVQAIEIKQSFMKRLLGLAEVKLTTAGHLGEEKEEVNSLYPFLPLKQAYSIISEILPAYEITSEMEALPRKSLWARMLRPSWIWIIATGLLIYFKPSLFGLKQAWWLLSVVLLIWIAASRYFNYLFTRYIIRDQFIQFRTGGFTSNLFVSKREKIVEVKVTRSYIQRIFELASICTVNRARPIQHHEVHDIPLKVAEAFYTWYMERMQEIKLDSGREDIT